MVSATAAWLRGRTKQLALIAQGEGIHWTALDEDISVEGLLHGQQSRERHASLEEWLQGRIKKSHLRRKTHNKGLQPPVSRTKKSAGSKGLVRSRRLKP